MIRSASACITASANLHQELSKKLGSDYIVVPRNGFAFRIKFLKKDMWYATGMSISVPCDANENINKTGIVYEMALFNHHGNILIYNYKFGYSDVCRFKTIDEIILELGRVRALVIKGDKHQIHNCESDYDEYAEQAEHDKFEDPDQYVEPYEPGEPGESGELDEYDAE